MILDSQAARGRSLVDVLREAAAHGVRLFQYRDKLSPLIEAYRAALKLRDAAAEAGATFLINDRCDLALAVEADGVHLGQKDLPLPKARGLLGPGKIIGISTHQSAQVTEATDGGADYLGVGPIFPTNTKPDHTAVVGLEGLRQVRPLTDLPIFAIGGVTLDTVAMTIQAGADGVAVVSAVATASDVGRMVRDLLAQIG
ncbi:thiamine phosphate synthase [Nitrospiraceae bacterium AH_259_D15_M11_P09]|nr:thiamine phosphate synthase [Nitrospiraceae bacterium AH_259_D15_M11_P09]